MMKSLACILLCAVMLSAPGPARCGEIHDAAKDGDLERVRSLVEKDGALVSARDEGGRTPLHWASYGVHLRVVVYLVEHGADVKALDSEGNSPLHALAARNCEEGCRLLISKGADVNVANYKKETPLHLAAEDDALEAAAVIVRAGADLECRNGWGRTPLIACARERGGPELTKLLIDAGAAVNAGDNWKCTPIELAGWRGKREVVDILLDSGATVPGEGFKTKLFLDFATSGGLDRLFDTLRAKGANLAAPMSFGRTLIHPAAAGGSAHIISALIEAGFNAAGADRFGWSPLHYAAQNGRLDAAKTLLERGADLNARTIMGQTPYNLAVDEGRTEVAAFLESKGADRRPILFPHLKGEYLGQKPPGATPEIFALGIVSSIWGHHSAIVFSPDGKEAYWSPSVKQPGEIYTRGAIFMSRLVDGGWAPPTLAPFAGGFGCGEPFFSPDGSRLYFNSGRPLPGDPNSGKERIWYVDRTRGGWSEPKPVDAIVNDQDMHWQFSVDARGNIYFGSKAAGGFGMTDIYCARFVDGRYLKPENLGSVINGPGNDHCPLISPDGSRLIFSRPDNEGDLFVSFRGAQGAWTAPVSVGFPVNTDAGELCPIISSDGKYLFFLSTREGESYPYWVEAKGLEALNPPAAAK